MSLSFPTFTKTWHSKPYDAISLTRPELSARGKVVIITGGGSGIGAETALSFAKAGATAVGIIGRREQKLVETQKKIEAVDNKTIVKYATADLTNATETEAAFQKLRDVLGDVDILVSNAGYLSDANHITSTAAHNDWWEGFEINVKGSYNAARAFLSVAAANPTLLNINTSVAHLPAMPGFFSYAASKLANAKMIEYLAAEQPELHVVNIHPGVIETDMNVKSGMPALDEIGLPAAFIVWLASPEAKFLRGKFVWVNWDVEELKARADEIKDSNLLTIILNGPNFV